MSGGRGNAQGAFAFISRPMIRGLNRKRKSLTTTEQIQRTASELEVELRRTASSVKVRTVDEMEAKLNGLADVAGRIAELATASVDCTAEDHIKEANDL